MSTFKKKEWTKCICADSKQTKIPVKSDSVKSICDKMRHIWCKVDLKLNQNSTPFFKSSAQSHFKKAINSRKYKYKIFTSSKIVNVFF